MNCDRAQAVLSDRLDGERAPERVASAVEQHTATCHRCRAFEASALRLRTSVRVRLAEPVPDLVGAIMARVAADPAAHPPMPRTIRRPRADRGHRLTPVIAAAVAGLMAGSVVVGGPWQRSSTGPIAAAAVVADVQRAAPSLDAFEATFAITEHGLSPDVPERRLRMDVAFLAPQRFRLDVHDETTYPSTRWTPTDLTLIADGSSTYRTGRHRVSGRPPCGRMPSDADHDHGHAPLTRSKRRRPRGSGVAADDVLVGGRHPGGGTGSRRGTRRDPDAAVVLARADALPVPAAGRHVASVLRRRSGRAVAGRCRLVPAALHGLSVDHAVAPCMGAPVRPSQRTERPADLRRATHVGRPRRTRRGDVRRSRRVRRGGRAVGLVPPPGRVPAGNPHGTGRPPPVIGGRAAGRRPRRATIGPALHRRHGVRADRRTPAPGGLHALRPDRSGRTAGGAGRRRVAYYEPAGEGIGRRLAIHAADTDVFLESNLPEPGSSRWRRRSRSEAKRSPMMGGR